MDTGAEGTEDVRGKAHLGVDTKVAQTKGPGSGGEQDREQGAEVPVGGGVGLGDRLLKVWGVSLQEGERVWTQPRAGRVLPPPPALRCVECGRQRGSSRAGLGKQWYLQGGAPVGARRGSEPVMLPVQRAQWETLRGLGRDGDELGDVQSQIRMGSGV